MIGNLNHLNSINFYLNFISTTYGIGPLMKTSIRESLGICGDVDMFKIILVRKMHAYLLQCAKSQRTG